METGSRRNFLAACLGAVAAAGAGATLYPVYKYLAPRKADGNGVKVSFPEAEVPQGGAKFFDFRGEAGVIIRKNINQWYPILLMESMNNFNLSAFRVARRAIESYF